MNIADVTAHGLTSPINPPRQYRFNGETREIQKRDVVLVSAETRDGEIGWAPCGTTSFAKWEEFNEATLDDITSVINDIVRPKLVGKSIDRVERVHEVIADSNLRKYLQWQAISVIDIALHDILGKRREPRCSNSSNTMVSRHPRSNCIRAVACTSRLKSTSRRQRSSLNGL